MPRAVPIACSAPRCPGFAWRKGKCRRHTLPNDGYSPAWRSLSVAVRRQVGRCEDCGSREDLTVDHLTPGSLGGTDGRRNLRVRCRRCHALYGARSDRMGRGAVAGRLPRSDPAASDPNSRASRNPGGTK